MKRLLFIIFLLLSTIGWAQKKKIIKIEYAEEMSYDRFINKEMQKLKGNVVFSHDSIYMYCDSAYFYSETNSLDAFSNVHIKQSDTLNLYGDTLHYEGNTRKAKMRGNVELVDNEIILTTDNLTYDLIEDKAFYRKFGKIVDTRNILTSLKGDYYAETKEFFFNDSVVITNPSYTMYSDTLKYVTNIKKAYFYGPTHILSDENKLYCENGWYDTENDVAQFKKNAILISGEQTLTGDSLFYNRRLKIGKAYQNVEMIDTVQDFILNGHYGEYYETIRFAILTDQAMMTQVNQGDSLFLHGDTLKANLDTIDSNKVLYAYDKAKFFSEDLQGAADSIVYTFSDSIIILFYDPVIWTEENQLTGDTIRIFTKNKKVDQLRLYNNSFIISKDQEKKFNQIKGTNIIGYFRDNKLKKINVFGQGEVIYFVRDDLELLIGVNKSRSEDIVITVQENKIKGISFIRNVEGGIIPIEDLSPNDLFLKDFKLRIKNRPLEKADIFNWNVE